VDRPQSKPRPPWREFTPEQLDRELAIVEEMERVKAEAVTRRQADDAARRLGNE